VRKFLFVLQIVIITIFLGCNAPDRNPIELESERTTGYLIDAPVRGVEYTCADISGITNIEGAFEFRQTCTVEFRIGNVLIGAIPGAAINADNRVYPSDLAGVTRNTINAPLEVRILRILQGLDNDNNPSNGIIIPDKAREDFKRLSLNVLDETLTDQTIIDAFAQVGYTLEDEDKAIEHYRQTIRDDLNITIVVIPAAAPSIVDQTFSIAENSDLFTPLATLRFGPGDDPNFRFMLTSSEFNITNRGEIVALVPLDFERKTQYQFDVNISSSAGSDVGTVTINVADLPDVAFVLGDTNISIDENRTVGDLIATVPVIQNSDVNSSTYALTGLGSENFAIDADGNITVAQALDFETQPLYTLQAERSSVLGTVSADVNITLNDIKDTVATINDLNISLFDNTLAGTTIGDIVVAAQGDAPTQQYLLSGSGNSNFTIDANGRITTTALLNAEVQSEYNLSVVLRTAAGDSSSARLSISVNEGGPLITQKVTVESTGAFGTSMVQNSSFIFVGAPEDNSTGAIYQFNNDENITLVRRIVPSGLQSGERFGSSMVLDGNNLFISAPNRDLNSSNNGQLYRYDITAQTFLSITPPDDNRTQNFGRTLAQSGNLLAVSATFDQNSSDSRGVVFLYNTSSSTPVATLQTTTVNNSTFGTAIALNGSELFIGAPDDGVGGKVYYYPHNDTNITTAIARELTIESGVSGAQLGGSIEANSTTLLVGASSDFGGEGSFYRYNKAGVTYNYFATYSKISPRASSDAFGSMVAFGNGQFIANTTNGTGQLYLVVNNTTQTAVVAPDSQMGDAFGSALLIQDARSIISAPNSGEGAIYVLENEPENRPYFLQTAQSYDVKNGERDVTQVSVNSLNGAVTMELSDPSGLFELQNSRLQFISAARPADGISHDLNITLSDSLTSIVKQIHVNVVQP